MVPEPEETVGRDPGRGAGGGGGGVARCWSSLRTGGGGGGGGGGIWSSREGRLTCTSALAVSSIPGSPMPASALNFLVDREPCGVVG